MNKLRPLPAPKPLAQSLASAEPGELVACDRKGNIRTPKWFRRRQWLIQGSVGLFTGISCLYALILPSPLRFIALSFTIPMALWATNAIGQLKRLQTLPWLMQEKQWDEFETIVQKCLQSWWLPRSYHGLAESALVGLMRIQGNHEAALQYLYQARNHLLRKTFHYRQLD